MFNKLSTRFIFILFLIGIIPLGIFGFIINITIPHSVENIETKKTQDNMFHVQRSLRYQIQDLIKANSDYANWDETYEKVGSKDKIWLEENITQWLSTTFKHDLIIITNKSGEIIASFTDNEYSNEELASLPEISRSMAGETFNGFMRINDKLYIMVVSSILRTDESGPANGMLLSGRCIDPQLLKEYSERVGYEIGYWFQNNTVLPEKASILGESKKINFSPDKISDGLYIHRTPSIITTFFPIYDIWGEVTAYLIIGENRTLFQSQITNIKNLLIKISLIDLLLIIIFSYLLTKTTLGPLKKLQSAVKFIKEEKKPMNFTLTGPTEIVSLSQTINEMAISLEEHIILLEEKNTILTRLSITDGLTNLYNYRFLHDQLNELINCGTKSISLIMFDINKFKYYNDTFGHLAGDMILKVVGKIINEHLPEKCFAARYGGDEFAAVLPGYSINQATEIAKNIQDTIEKLDFLEKYQIPYNEISISAGVASYPSPAQSIYVLVKMADQELYNTKNFSQNKIGQYFSVLHDLRSEINNSEEELAKFAKLMLVIINAKDKYTYYHTENVVKFSTSLANAMGLSTEEIKLIALGATLHDIGKVEVEKNILTKNGPLTEPEWRVIKQHPIWGAEMMALLKELNGVELLVRHHHERFDGKGYPDKLSGSNIPIGARIIAVADSFDAMTTNRPYKKALTIPEALLELEKNSGTQFDPEIVKVFLEIVNDII